jgi:hypothetical protein
VLGDVGRYDDWLAREDPSEAAQRVAAWMIGHLSKEPYAAPSIPFDTSDQPVSEVRSLALPVPGEPDVRVWYRHTYASGRVDLLGVTNRR